MHVAPQIVVHCWQYAPDMPETRPRWCPRHAPVDAPYSIIFDIKEHRSAVLNKCITTLSLKLRMCLQVGKGNVTTRYNSVKGRAVLDFSGQSRLERHHTPNNIRICAENVIQSLRALCHTLNIARGTTDPEIDSVTCIRLTTTWPLTIVANLTTRWRHLH